MREVIDSSSPELIRSQLIPFIKEYHPVWSVLWHYEPQTRGLMMEAFVAKGIRGKRIGQRNELVDIITPEGIRVSMKTYNVRANVRLTRKLEKALNQLDEIWVFIKRWGPFGTCVAYFFLPSLDEDAFMVKNDGYFHLKVFPQYASDIISLPTPEKMDLQLVDQIVEMLLERI